MLFLFRDALGGIFGVNCAAKMMLEGALESSRLTADCEALV